MSKNLVDIETKILKAVYQDSDGNFVFLDNEDFEVKQPYQQRILSKKQLQFESNEETVMNKPVMSRLVNK